MEPVFFEDAKAFRAWLSANHERESELWVGFRKRGTGLPSITWPEAVDEALCVGWIDAVRKSIDETSYMIRFTRRKPGSIWSTVNIARVEALAAEERMQPAGLAAFAKREEARSGVYSHEQSDMPELSTEQEAEFRANPAAWEFFQSRPGSYRKAAIWGIVSAKKDETKAKRLAELIECSARGETVPRLTRPAEKKRE
jgi:uncharacterized protein YdeI (YjbR/CyaY-like superfamily)